MRRKHFIFTNKKHSKPAIMSAILGVISLTGLGIIIYISYSRDGVVPGRFGFTGFLAMLYSLVGLGIGIYCFRDKDYFRLFPLLGIILNGAALGIISLLLYFGINV